MTGLREHRVQIVRKLLRKLLRERVEKPFHSLIQPRAQFITVYRGALVPHGEQPGQRDDALPHPSENLA